MAIHVSDNTSLLLLFSGLSSEVTGKAVASSANVAAIAGGTAAGALAVGALVTSAVYCVKKRFGPRRNRVSDSHNPLMTPR